MKGIVPMAVAALGDAASVSLYAAPIVTFQRVIRKKMNTEEFSCVPYIIGLLNCLLFTWYGMPIVSNEWENYHMVIVNGVGIVLEFSYILIYFWYTSPKRKVCVATTAIPVVVAFCTIAIISAFAFQDHRHGKLLVGSIGLVVALAMYGQPLYVTKKVFETKSAEFMPLPFSLCLFFASVLRLTYGVMIGDMDIFIMIPSAVGTSLAILQLVLHCKYWKRKVAEEPTKKDLEKGSSEKVNVEKADLELGNTEKNVTKQSNQH